MKPLEGLVVVERGDGVGIRFAGRLLAQLGAEVSRPDGPGTGAIGYGGAAGRAYAAWLDEGKATGTPEAPALALVEEDGPDAPGALTAELSWFDPEGPRAGWRGTDSVVEALAGLASTFGEADGPPTLAQGEAPQIIAGATLCIAALAGLIGRRGGCGPERVSTSVHEAVTVITEGGPMGFVKGGPASSRRGVNRFWPTFPQTNWPTGDGWLGTTALTPAQWRALCDLAGLPEMGADPRFAESEQRAINAEEISVAFAPKLAARSAVEWAAEGQAKRVPLAVCAHPGETPQDPHWQARGSFAPAPGADGVVGPRAPYIIEKGAPRQGVDRHAPLPGLPLAGLRVADFAMGWSGPLASRHLADLGADVVKIESRSHPDWWRGWDDMADMDPPPQELRPGFIGMNRNKRGVLLDTTNPQEVAMARALVAGSDALVDNFAPGVLGRLGFDAATVQALSPGLVHVSMGAFGASGPQAGWRGYGSTVEQASGMCFVSGEAHWPPALRHIAFGDAVAGLFSAVGLLAGLWGRDRQGGAVIDLGQVECLFQIAASACIAEQVTGAPVPRTGSRRPDAAPSGVFPALGDDAWLALEVRTEAEWRALCEVMGLADLAADAGLAEAPGRLARADEIDAAISRWTSTRDPDDAAHALQAAGVPAAPVVRPHLLHEEPQLAEAGYWRWLDRRHIGRHLVAGPPYRLDGARPDIRRPAPVMGEHDDEILAPLRAAAAAKREGTAVK